MPLIFMKFIPLILFISSYSKYTQHFGCWGFAELRRSYRASSCYAVQGCLWGRSHAGRQATSSCGSECKTSTDACSQTTYCLEEEIQNGGLEIGSKGNYSSSFRTNRVDFISCSGIETQWQGYLDPKPLKKL